MLTVAIASGGSGRLRIRRPGQQLLRGLCQAAGVPLSFYAYGRIPIADAYAVLFTMPLLVVALSAPLLGERGGQRRWAAVAAGFAGVLAALRPGAGLLGAATL